MKKGGGRERCGERREKRKAFRWNAPDGEGLATRDPAEREDAGGGRPTHGPTPTPALLPTMHPSSPAANTLRGGALACSRLTSHVNHEVLQVHYHTTDLMPLTWGRDETRHDSHERAETRSCDVSMSISKFNSGRYIERESPKAQVHMAAHRRPREGCTGSGWHAAHAN